MPTLPAQFTSLVAVFSSLFSKRVWHRVPVLLAGAILATGRRTVAALLRVMGLDQERQFQAFHRVLNRASWSSLAASRRLLLALVQAFVPNGPIVLGMDDTIERRWGKSIAARGIYRDPWYGAGERQVEWVSDTCVWYPPYHAGLPAVPIRWLLVRDPQGRFDAQAFLSTDLTHTPQQMLQWFIQRWQVEVTFEEARAHLGIETQRQWSHRAIARTTPILLALYSLVTLMAQACLATGQLPVRAAAWYAKTQPTFSDTLAWVRRWLWSAQNYSMSPGNPVMIKIPRPLFERLTDVICYAANG